MTVFMIPLHFGDKYVPLEIGVLLQTTFRNQKKVFSNDSVLDYDCYICDDDVPFVNPVIEYGDIDSRILETPISEQEIKTAINHLKNGKSAGPDHIVIEMIKCSQTELKPHIQSLGVKNYLL